MNKRTLMQTWDHIRQINGVGLRAIELIPEAKLDASLILGMRTPKEMAVHMYGQVIREVAEGALSGEIRNEVEKNEKQIAGGLKTRTELLQYCRECWNAADRATNAMTDESLMNHTKTPWGMEFPAFVAYTLMSDEYIHHRGQIYAYLRTLGIQPPNLWGFDQNAPEFQPRAATSA